MIIGITGLKRSGKNSVGDILCKSEYEFNQIAFADPIKEAAKVIFDWDSDFIENHKEDIDTRWGISPRQALQHIGTEWSQYALPQKYPEFNAVTGRELWMKRCMMEIMRNPKNGRYVITDLRFPHEAEAIRATGGIIIEVVRDGNIPGFITKDMHESESHKLAADLRIDNNGTLEDLEANVLRAIKVFMER